MTDPPNEASSDRSPRIGSRGVAWLQLLRLPNVFTAVADVMMGFLITHRTLEPLSLFALLVVASSLLYLSGMVLNDVFDVAVDSEERPQRPIPSGRVALASAAAAGWALLVSGMLVAWLASFLTGDWRPGVVGSALAACIVLYDSALKRTPLAPLVMGGCRMLNVLLGMSLAAVAAAPLPALPQFQQPRAWTAAELLIAAGIGIYITGVTWFARTEARASARAALAGGTLTLLAGLALIASLPVWVPEAADLVVAARGWYLLWAVLALIIARRCVLAIYQPTPARVQAAVRHAIHSLIVVDAAICLGYVGIFWGCAVLLLLFPTLALTRWLNAT